MFAEDEAALLVEAAGTPDELEALVRARTGGLPLEHVLGWADFCGLRVHVAPGVFVPRRRTELLAREAVALLGPGAVVVDLCCGCGAVAAVVAAAARDLPGGIELHAADVDPAALACARRNLAGAGQVHGGDLLDALPPDLAGRVDVLVANAPYVPTAAIALMPPEAREHEARLALDGGADGLDVQRRILAGAGRWLAADGHLLVETSERQAPATAAAFARRGLGARVVRSGDLDATVVVGRRGG